MRAARKLVVGMLALAVLSGCQSTSGGANKASNDGGPTVAPTSRATTAGDDAWQIPQHRVAGMMELSGYADHVSVPTGQPFRLFVTSTAGAFTVRAFRIGWYGGAGAKLVWTSSQFPGKAQPQPILTKERMVTAINWSPTTTVQTKGWPAGSYLLLLRASNGKETYVPIVIRSDSARGAVLIVNGVNTDQAYNGWGGFNLYVGGRKHSHDQRSMMVTFDRPYAYNPARGVLHDNLPLVQLAERSGVRLAYATSVDLQADPGLLAGARAIVFGGHDEYWSLLMRQAVTKARDAGTNLAFLGANSIYRRMRYAADPHGPNRIIVDYKDAGLDPVHNAPDTTVNWRQYPFPDPENSLVGMLYECFPASGAFTVREPGFFLFAGTGAKAGSAYPGLVGNEADRAYPIKGTPANLQVVAHSPTTCAKRHTFSDATYYTVKSGAGVFATGTIEWVRALQGPDPKYGVGPASVAFAQKVTLNLFTALAAGPMGRTHPAVGNLAGVHNLASTSTGTGGPVGKGGPGGT
ncbi:N,N-dimethylformamidase beta subunit family domain-containing protein [Kribbella sp.]|uniref:N,N-dimethylformamidase beta subunit family domain-containing protein n=1 Tax=Kribbella sp. TaxID=1871183 RepID=UPI002D5C5590|nr:N,N-dimethylformamidase beta subunit family domain-containing protein [Kribbella sp.]HZX02797.1 N,N-dimethylformamidase beta subunit family domain-containing protein [Kribbella sp.]